MFRRLLLAAVFAGSAHAAAAQPQDTPIIEMQGRDPRPEPGPRVRLFISPMGEPFRGPDGFGAWLAGADANHDSAVTPDEFRADGERFFKLLDTDGSGFIDGFEMQAYERERVPEIATVGIEEGPRGGRFFGGGAGRAGGARRGGSAPPGDKPQEAAPDLFRGAGRDGAARFSLLNISQPVANCDEDGNGRVTLLEWNRAATRRFEALDKAKTSRLTRDGLRPPPASADKRKR